MCMLSVMPRQSRTVQAKPDRLVDEAEALRMLGNATRRSLKWWRDTRQIEYVRVGKSCRYSARSIEQFIGSRTVKAQP